MPPKSSELVQGTLEMLILKTLALEPMHGYGIALRIEQISKGVFKVNAGSLFPAFSRLERAGRIKGEWRTSETTAAPNITRSPNAAGNRSKMKPRSGGGRSQPLPGFWKPDSGSGGGFDGILPGICRRTQVSISQPAGE